MLLLTPYGYAEDLVFPKTRLSSPNGVQETAVTLTITDSALVIGNAHNPRSKSGAEQAVALEIPFSTIVRIRYGLTDRRRVLEGIALTPWLMFAKEQSHWLVIEHGAGTPPQPTLLRLHKNEFQGVIAVLNARAGKPVEVLDPGSSVVDPTVGSFDVDAVLPFSSDQVFAALKASMEGFGCRTGKLSKGRMECHRGLAAKARTGAGGELVTAILQPSGEGTRLTIKTSRGLGRNWSSPIFRETQRRLESPPASPVGLLVRREIENWRSATPFWWASREDHRERPLATDAVGGD